MSTLKDRIAECMRRRPDIRPIDIAKACGIAAPSVSGWISGETKRLKAETGRKASQLFGCDQNWLCDGVGLPNWGGARVSEPQTAHVTLAAALQVLGDALQDMDPGTRRRVMSLIADLEVDPASHAQVAAAIEAMRELSKNRRAA